MIQKLDLPIFFAAVLLGSTGVTLLPAAHAGVVPGDTFSIETIVYNTGDSSGNYFDTDPGLIATFGTTTVFPGAAAGPEGTFQDLTVSSFETTAGGMTTDSITISAASNLVTSNVDRNGNLANAMEFSIGMYNTGTDTLDFTAPPVGSKLSGSVTYTFNGQTKTAALNQTVMTANGKKSFSVEEAVQSFNPDLPLADYDITAFNLSVTYTAVPEPSTVAAMLAGAGGILWMAARRRLARA